MERIRAVISCIILTYNEEKHIERCIHKARELTDQVWIIDSGSNDKTRQIAESCGAKVIQNPWPGNQADQFNWALENLPIHTEWVLRLDADEYLLPELVSEIKSKIDSLPEDITGIFLKRRVIFLEKWIRFGGYYPTYLLRLWKHKAGKYEAKLMDEHVKLDYGKTTKFSNDFVDHNLNDLSWWIQKHNHYSDRECDEIMKSKHKADSIKKSSIARAQAERKRWYKENIYLKLPLFIRAFLYFIYRYIFQFGFLDGRQGLIWHFLQGFWYRFLVDAKIFEIKKRNI